MNIKKIIKKLTPLDYFIEKTKLTLLFNENRILILSDFDDKIMYCLFINRYLIASNIEDENIFIIKFKKYLEVK